MTAGAPSRAVVEWAARQTLRMHRETPAEDRATGRCAQCPAEPADCRQLRWAAVVLDVDGEPASARP